MNKMSSPLRRHAKHFAGSIKNLYYRLYPQGVSSPQLINSLGARQTDDDYCITDKIINKKITKYDTLLPNISDAFSLTSLDYCRNSGHCYSTNTGPKCDCVFTDFSGRQCETSYFILIKIFIFCIFF